MYLEVKNGSKAFGDNRLFYNLNVIFPSNSITALTGPSGCGKSTLLSILSGYESLDSGEVLIRESIGTEKVIVQPPRGDLVSWVPQTSALLPHRSALDNVAIASSASGSSYDDATALSRELLRLVDLETRIFDQASNLSGGEAQRVCLSRALATQKPFIFADEPTASLDRTATEKIADILRQLTFSCCVIVASHDPLLIDSCSQVINLRNYNE